jgi:hypothetical protein
VHLLVVKYMYDSSSLGGYNCKPGNFVFIISSIYLSLEQILDVEHVELWILNFIMVVLSRFRTKLCASHYLVVWERTNFDTAQKWSKCLLEIMTLVLYASIVGSDKSNLFSVTDLVCGDFIITPAGAAFGSLR